MKPLVILIVGLYVGYQAPVWLGAIVSYITKRRLMKSLLPVKAVQAELCKGPHPWLTARVMTDDGPQDKQICKICGLISGTDLVATPETIDNIEANIRVKNIEQKLYKEFLDLEDGDIKKFFAKEIEGGVSFDKLIRLHTHGITFNQRYAIFKASKAEEIEKALFKSDA